MKSYKCLFAFIICATVEALRLSNQRTLNRRAFVISAPVVISSFPSASQAATKAKGAAEYDLEFYLRDILKGNNKEGNLPASVAPPALPSRRLGQFVSFIVNDNLDDKCITIRTLSSISNASASEISNEIRNIRQMVGKAFFTKAPWKDETIFDEYYFDVTIYSLYRTAAKFIPNDYKLRDHWVRVMGEDIYQEMKKQNVFVSSSTMTKLTDTVPQIQAALKYFRSINMIESFELGDEKNDESRVGVNIFDSYDDQDVNAGISVNCLVSLKRPATIGSSLQITGEGSRFSPDFVSPTLAAIWKNELGLNVEYETYFVDSEYRENPKDFFPNEELLQFSIKI